MKKTVIKTLIAMLMILLALQAISQPNEQQQRTDSICAERGHICLTSQERIVSIQDTIIDLPSKSLLVFIHNIDNSFYCLRCKKFITERNEERDTIIVWKKWKN